MNVHNLNLNLIISPEMRSSLTILLCFVILILQAQKQTPTQYIESTLKPIKKIIKKNCIIINCSKGIDIKSSTLISDIIRKVFPQNTIGVLSGPNFAFEIAQGKPTASLIAAKSILTSKKIAR